MTVQPKVPFGSENSVRALEASPPTAVEPFVYDEAFWFDPSRVETVQSETVQTEMIQTEMIQDKVIQDEAPQIEPAENKISQAETFQFEAYQPEDFYLPVRSERFAQLKKTSESDVPQQVQEPELSMELLESDSFGISFPVEDTQTQQEKFKREEFKQKASRSLQNASSADPKGSLQNAYEVPTGRLKHVLRVLSLSLSDLASLFDLSLPEICVWFEEGTLDMEQEALLQYLSKVADRVEKNEIPRFNRVAARPFSDGEYFLDKLKRQKVTGEDLKILKETACKTEELCRKTKGSAKPFYAFQDTITLYSTPLYSDSEAE